MSPITRRTLLSLAGAATASAALTSALRAEGTGFSVLPDRGAAMFATSTPLFVQNVSLRVRDAEMMTRFYSTIIGLDVIAAEEGQTRLGVDGLTLLTLLHRPDAAFEPATEAGLYHTAFLMPSRQDLASWLIHTAIAQYPLSGFADHRVSEAVYLDDPEGNGIEVYSDRAPELWNWDGETVIMGSDPIDFDSLLALTPNDRDTYGGAPAGMRIGHVHLRAGSIDAARAFYVAALGLDVTSGRADAIFLSSGRYHHHVALNTWQSAGAGARDTAATGLAELTLQVAEAAMIETAHRRLLQAGASIGEIGSDRITATDPWGTSVRLVLA